MHTVQQDLAQKYQVLLSTSHDLEAAQARIKQLEKKVSTSSSITNLQNQILNRLALALENFKLSNTVMTPLSPTTLVPDFAVFRGDKSKFSSWKETVLLKLAANADHFPTDQTKMAYVYSMLGEDCQAHLHSWSREGTLTFSSLPATMNQLTILFDDPNRVQDAVARLHRNKQKNKAFSSWIAEIRRDAAIAGYENTQALTDIVFLNINLELQRALINEKDIDMLKFDEAVARIQDIDNRQRCLAESAANYRARKFLPYQISSNPYAQLTTTQGGDAMDLSISNVMPRGPLPQEEKERRRKLGLCYYCGKGVHKAVECSLLRKSQPVISVRLAEVTEVEGCADVLVGSSSKSRQRSSQLDLVLSSVAIGKGEWNKTSHFVVDYSIENLNPVIFLSLALIDSGASAYRFIDDKFAHDNQPQTIPFQRPRTLKVFDGSESSYGQIISMAKTVLRIGGHSETILSFVTALAYFDIVLGLPWLQYHNPEIRWAEEILKFNNTTCRAHLNNSISLVHAISPETTIMERWRITRAEEFRKPSVDIETCDFEALRESRPEEESVIMKVAVEDIEKAPREKPKINPAVILSKIYHKYLPVFSRDGADKLPPHRPSGHRIVLKPGYEAP
ncbi:hypothetical protein K3495_g9307 [Podosphaera aphanis]|nr:hypothetical protein K3495_g9307 [Podosphaera aphanis]